MNKYLIFLTFPKMRSSGDDWCVHYAGFYDKNAPMQKRTCCDAGIEYATVETKVDFTYCHYGDKHVYTSKTAHPCFKCKAHLTNGCSKQRFNTLEELQTIHEERDKSFERIRTARAAILTELKRRYDMHDPDVKLNSKPSPDSMCHEDELENFISGAGAMVCPNCKTGNIRYSRAAFNGHIHAKCSTKNCAAWME